MAIQTTYNFKGISVTDAYIRVDRLWGSSKEGWTALVGVYNITTEAVPETELMDGTIVPASTQTVHNKLEEFNHSCDYSELERGYTTMYASLMTKYGGIEV